MASWRDYYDNANIEQEATSLFEQPVFLQPGTAKGDFKKLKRKWELNCDTTKRPASYQILWIVAGFQLSSSIQATYCPVLLPTTSKSLERS
jgi:hypothetical protein